MFVDQLDFVPTSNTETITENVENWLEKLGLLHMFDVEVITERGPGGGAPIVAFMTEFESSRRAMLTEYFNDEAEVDDYINSSHFDYDSGARLEQGTPTASQEG